MLNKVKISYRQFIILSVLFTIGSAILVVPSSIASIAKQDAWIATLAGLAIGIVIVLMYNLLAKQHPGKNLVEMLDALLGKWFGRTVALLFVATIFLFGPAAVLNILGNFLTTQMMPETPIQSLNILFTVIVVIGVYLGIETLARSAELIFPWIAFLYIAFIILVAFDIKLTNIQPVLEDGMKPIWQGAVSFLATAFLPNIVLLMIFPTVDNQPSQAGRALLIGSIIGSIVTIVIIIMTIMVFGPEFTARSIYPSYALARKISIGNFLQRIEAIMATIWFISLFFRMALYMYAISIAISHIFNLKDYRAIVLPLGMLMVVMSVIIYPSISYELSWDARTWIPYTIVIGFIIPLLLLCLSGFRNLNKR